VASVSFRTSLADTQVGRMLFVQQQRTVPMPLKSVCRFLIQSWMAL
jgi:hypothetical protein